jgi:hypothetical protein
LNTKPDEFDLHPAFLIALVRSSRKFKDEFCELSFLGLHGHLTPVGFHHVIAQRQSKTGALSCRLGGEKRLEDLVDHFLAYAHSIFADPDLTGLGGKDHIRIRQTQEVRLCGQIKNCIYRGDGYRMASFQSSGDGSESVASSLPKEQVALGNPRLIDSLRAMGLTVIPIAAGNNYLTVSFLKAPVNPDSVLPALTGLKDQVLFLKLSGSKLSDAGATAIADLPKLTRLYIDRTKITDTGLMKLTTLKHLQYLNLTGTKVTEKCVMEMKGLRELKSVYLYQTKIKTEGIIELKKAFPGVMVDSGGYTVPFIADDTVTNRQATKAAKSAI